MKLRSISTLLATGTVAAGLAMAPVASAVPTGQTCTYLGSQTTQCQSPGNVQINSDQPVTYPYQFPFYGNVLLFHHGGHR